MFSLHFYILYIYTQIILLIIYATILSSVQYYTAAAEPTLVLLNNISSVF